jgi:hypothetical protein
MNDDAFKATIARMVCAMGRRDAHQCTVLRSREHKNATEHA